MSGGPVCVTFPNQFSLGNPENVPGKLEIHFDDLLVESIQRKSFQEIQKRRKAERRKQAKKREMDHQKIINQIKKIVSLMRKQESNHKKMMKLYKGMINMHGHALDIQCVDNELNNLQLHSSDLNL